MNILPHVGRLASLAVLAAMMTGCCVLPWGDGHGRGRYSQAERYDDHGDRGGHGGYRGEANPGSADRPGWRGGR